MTDGKTVIPRQIMIAAGDGAILARHQIGESATEKTMIARYAIATATAEEGFEGAKPYSVVHTADNDGLASRG